MQAVLSENTTQGSPSHSRTKAQAHHHIGGSRVQSAVSDAVAKTGASKRPTGHTSHHLCATHLIEAGYYIRTAQELLGHSNLKTAMIHIHVLNWSLAGVRSPDDRISSERSMPCRTGDAADRAAVRRTLARLTLSEGAQTWRNSK